MAAVPAIAELQSLRQWVCWRYEQKPGADKPTKVPYQPNGVRASSTDPNTWSSYEEVVHAPIRFDGVGVVVSEQDPYCGIDLDGCITDDDRFVGWAELIVAGFSSYTERSPSGRGVRIWIRGKLLGRGRSKKLPGGGGIEVYDRSRFFTITGQHVAGLPSVIEPRQGLLEEFMAAQWPEEPDPPPRPRSSSPPSLSDTELLGKAFAAANGAKFRRLWDGDTSGHKDDDSAADLALCNLLYFWTGGDLYAMDRLFRQSGLMRDKWDEKRGNSTWGQDTLRKAISRGGEVYTPSGRPDPQPPLAHPSPEQEDVVLFEPSPQEKAPPPPPALIHNTELGNARRLVARHGDALRYSFAVGWMMSHGGHWQVDNTGAVERRGKETVASMYEDASRLDADERKALASWALKSESNRAIKAMIELAKTEPGICVTPDQLDADPWLFNLRNGTFNLRTGILQPHDRDDLITKIAPVSYDPEALCPRWDQFLSELFDGDQERIGFVRRAVGYSLTGDTREQCLFFLTGLGANGKSTFLGVLRRLLGDYATTAALGLLTEQKGDDHPTRIADLAGRRLVASVEVGEGKRLAEELVKQLTGQDPLKGRKMHKDYFEFLPVFKLWLAANHKPNIRGTDHAIWRRIHTIPFEATFYDPADAAPGQPLKDTELPDTLAAELPGILAWAIRGCMEWQRVGLKPPAVVKDATRTYREEMDLLGAFLLDRCLQQPNARARSGALYSAYQEWCQASGEHALPQNAFSRKLTERGFKNGRDRYIGRFWDGVGLVDETTEKGLRIDDNL